MNPLSINKSWDIKILDLFWRKGVVLFVPNQHCKLFFESVLLRTGLNVCLKFPKNLNFLLLCYSVFEWLIQVMCEICKKISWKDYLSLIRVRNIVYFMLGIRWPNDWFIINSKRPGAPMKNQHSSVIKTQKFDEIKTRL